MTTAVATGAAALSAADRCDRCGAQAYLKVELQSGGELLFCAHHAREHGDALKAVAANVVDETHRLADTPPFRPTTERRRPTDRLTTAPDPRSGAVCVSGSTVEGGRREPDRGPGRPGDPGRPGRHPGARSCPARCSSWPRSWCGRSPSAAPPPGRSSRWPRWSWSSARSSSTPSRAPAQGDRHPVVDEWPASAWAWSASSWSRWSACSSASCWASTSPSGAGSAAPRAWPSTKEALRAVGVSILIELAAGVLAAAACGSPASSPT